MELGVTEEEYYETAPYKTDALVDAWLERKDKEARAVALQCWAVHNASGIKKSDGTHFIVEDFLPSPPMSDELKEELLQARLITLTARQNSS